MKAEIECVQSSNFYRDSLFIVGVAFQYIFSPLFFVG